MAKISTIENETDLRNYLLKATKNAALDHLRKHRHERVRTEEENETDVPDSEEMPDDALVEKIHNRIEYKKDCISNSIYGRHIQRCPVLSLCIGAIGA